MIPWNLYFTTIRPFKNSPLLTINFSVRGEFIQCWVWELKYISMPEQSWGYMVNQTGSITFVLTFKGNLELCPLQICHFIDKCVTLANELGSTSSQISVKWIIIAKWQELLKLFKAADSNSHFPKYCYVFCSWRCFWHLLWKFNISWTPNSHPNFYQYAQS